MAQTTTPVLAAIVLTLLTLPAGGEEEKRERIPSECRDLANRAGLPLTLSRAEAVRAIAYLSVMRDGDSAVVRCRLAVLRR